MSGRFQFHLYLRNRFGEFGLEQPFRNLATSLRLFPSIKLFGSPVPENDAKTIVPDQHTLMRDSQQVRQAGGSASEKKAVLVLLQSKISIGAKAGILVYCHDFVRACARSSAEIMNLSSHNQIDPWRGGGRLICDPATVS